MKILMSSYNNEIQVDLERTDLDRESMTSAEKGRLLWPAKLIHYRHNIPRSLNSELRSQKAGPQG